MRTWSAATLVTATLFLAACRDVSQPTSPVAPSFSSAPQNRPVYVITFKRDMPDVPGEARRHAANAGSTPMHTYTRALHGFAAPMSAAAAEALSHNPNVESVELDQPVSASTVQTPATWGLDRIDQRNLPLNNAYDDFGASGAGVTVYIIDTGILTSHTEFGGRASGGFTAINDGNGTSDCNGHGTHVSGTVGGTTYGVAQGVSLVAVRVLNCSGSGTTAGVIAGIDWVTANKHLPAVANMSLGGGASSALDQAVANAVAAGVTFAVAAGNDNANACNYSPARATSAITVGATTTSDARASYSNFGTCVDIFAPGSGITSSWNTSNSATNTISGTSMATPHVTGTAALYLETHSGASPATVTAALTGNASSGRVTSAGAGSPNLLLYTGSAGDTPPPPPSISLAVTISTKGRNSFGNLSWSGASTNISVYRNGAVIATGSGTSYQDNLGRGSGTVTYKVCSGASCSNAVTKSY